VDDIIDGLLAMGIKEEAVGEAINLGSGKEHRVIDMANMVNALTGQTLRKFNQQTFKKGLIQKRYAEAGIKYVEKGIGMLRQTFLSNFQKV